MHGQPAGIKVVSHSFERQKLEWCISGVIENKYNFYFGSLHSILYPPPHPTIPPSPPHLSRSPFREEMHTHTNMYRHKVYLSVISSTDKNQLYEKAEL